VGSALRRWGDEVLPDYYEGYHILVKHNGLKSRRCAPAAAIAASVAVAAAAAQPSPWWWQQPPQLQLGPVPPAQAGGGRAFSSNRDPQGKQIKARTPAMATERLQVQPRCRLLSFVHPARTAPLAPQALRTELEGLEGDVQERRISELARVERCLSTRQRRHCPPLRGGRLGT
jgi:hypothetical protein